MLYSLTGQLIEKSPVHAVIDCNGVGYFLNISLATYSALPNNGEVMLYTHLHVNGNDFSLVLYGFYSDQEKELFKKLTSVSGVGPNTARMVLSSLNVNELIQVIANKDLPSLKRIKGIGEKTAERILVDLHNKVGKIEGVVIEKIGGVHNTTRQDALVALSQLGLDKTKTEKMLDKILLTNGELPLEELIKQVLKQI
jgi:Holliday junction DNA helicase RuvA